MPDHTNNSKNSRNLKRKIRERMQKTGESYTAARTQILNAHIKEQPTANSQEWMNQLEILVPHQAIITEIIVERAQRQDICSICGDSESSEYRPLDHKKGVTLRLCEDCKEIRFRRFGEKWTPLGRSPQHKGEQEPLVHSSTSKKHVVDCSQCQETLRRSMFGDQICDAIKNPFEPEEPLRRIGNITILPSRDEIDLENLFFYLSTTR